MTDADEPVVDVDLEARFLGNGVIQAAVGEARAHPERRVPRRDRTTEREESGE